MKALLSFFVIAFIALPSFAENKIFVEAVLQDNLVVCSRCNKPTHLVEGKESAKMSFTGQLKVPAGILPEKIEIVLRDSEGGTQRPRYWDIKLNKDTEAGTEFGTRYWKSDYYTVSLDSDGNISLFVRGLTLTRGWAWDLKRNVEFPIEVTARDHERHDVGQVKGMVKALSPKVSQDLILTNPFNELELKIGNLKALDLKDLVHKRKQQEDFSLISKSWQSGPQKIFIVVPVYREFYNENIGSLLISLANQGLNAFGSGDVHVVFNVNNTKAASPEVRIENQETVAYLKALAKGEIPSVRPHSEILRRAIYMVLASGMKIHVLDNTEPGYGERNIGRVRDDAVRYALTQTDPKHIKDTLIAQMDADSRVPQNYLQRLHEEFSDPNLKFGLMSLVFGTERNSSLQTFRRMIMAQIWFASYAYYDASEGRRPLSGSPRIVATAEAIMGIGGIPHETVGEDTKLVANLSQRYPRAGKWLYDLAVETSFRGRPDGYDAKYYLKRMDEPVELQENERKLLTEVRAKEKELDSVEAVKDFRHQRLLEILSIREKEVRARLALLKININEMASENRIVTIDSRIDLGLYSTPEFEPYLRKLLVEAKGDKTTVLGAVVERFPHLLKIKPPVETLLWARLTAATDTILSRNQIMSDYERTGRKGNSYSCAHILTDLIGAN